MNKPRQTIHGSRTLTAASMLRHCLGTTAFALVCLFQGGQLQGLDLAELRKDPELTPKKLMSEVREFQFKFGGKLKNPDEFLLSRSGDCDDFAVMADLALRPKGYDTRLVGIQMPGAAHIVCYVIDDRVYLDYNNRIYFMNLIRCDASIRAVATKVAKSFRANWTTASEYVYQGNQQLRAIATVVKTEPPHNDPAFGERPGGIKVDF